jgi:hypothetical protein
VCRSCSCQGFHCAHYKHTSVWQQCVQQWQQQQSDVFTVVCRSRQLQEPICDPSGLMLAAAAGHPALPTAQPGSGEALVACQGSYLAAALCITIRLFLHSTTLFTISIRLGHTFVVTPDVVTPSWSHLMWSHLMWSHLMLSHLMWSHLPGEAGAQQHLLVLVGWSPQPLFVPHDHMVLCCSGCLWVSHDMCGV